MRILQLSTYDRAGGAEKVAFDLHNLYRKNGHDARMLVRFKRTTDNNISEVNVYQQTMRWAPLCSTIERHIRHFSRFRGRERIIEWLRKISLPQRWINQWQGFENFNFPYSHNLLNDLDWCPDIIHAHNLHGDYFDLRALVNLSKRIPTIWTLHDAWALTGHCAHFVDIGCNRWRKGCGKCPDLKRYPGIRKDKTVDNWQRKRRIYFKSRLAVATPSRWLMDLVEQSMLYPYKKQIVPNGVDVSVFRPSDRNRVRNILNLPQNVFICMCIAQNVNKSNPFKDFATIEQAARFLKLQSTSKQVMIVCVGRSSAPSEDPNIFYTGYIENPHKLAMYYQAADVMLHAAHAETFSLVLIEAASCGIPAITTAVGGIPELVVNGETGFLIAPGDSKSMAQRALKLINQPDLCRKMGQSAVSRVQQTYNLNQQAETYLQWFEELRALYKEFEL
ncbi:MAG: glycosyltransferase [Bacteroidetes bacterium]|nr:glycosyltransferase [Bacteroidota bacterium]